MNRHFRVSRRTVLTTVGTIGLGSSVSGRAKPARDQFSRFEIRTAAPASNVQYEFTTDGSVYAFTYPPEIAAESGGNDTVEKRANDTFRVRGRTGQGDSDTWLVDGQLLTFETEASEQAYTLVWNGEEIPPPSPGNRFEIQTAPQTSNVQYEFLTDGPVEAITQPPDIKAEPNGNDSVTRRADGVYHVTGLAGGGNSDTWRIDGEVAWFDTTASEREYTLRWNGNERPPNEVGNGDGDGDENGDGDGTAQIEFLDCSKFRIVGDYEQVYIEFGGYAEGQGVGDYIAIGPVSGETIVDYETVWPSHEIDRSDYFHFWYVAAYKNPDADGPPDVKKEHPNRDACRRKIRPTKPVLRIEDITRRGPSAYDVTFGYTNPNTIVVRGEDSFAAGNARGSPPETLRPGQHTFTVRWQPESDDERLRWEFVPLGYYNTGVTVSVATPPHAEVRKQ